MPKILYFSEKVGSGVTLQLDSGETCLISVAQTSVLVKGYRGRFGQFWISFFGSILYQERNVHKAAETGVMLRSRFPRNDLPVSITNPVLKAFANAAWHCSTVVQVAVTLNEANR